MMSPFLYVTPELGQRRRRNTYMYVSRQRQPRFRHPLRISRAASMHQCYGGQMSTPSHGWTIPSVSFDNCASVFRPPWLTKARRMVNPPVRPPLLLTAE
jgi:hypothetical protein